jgi:predicted Zn-dependent protease
LIDRIGLAPALIGSALLAALTLVGLWRGAGVAAHLVPEAWEVALGDSLTGDFGAKACVTPAGQRALDTLALRLAGDGKPVTVRVVDLDIVNAVALPGRRVLLFRGLIAQAHSPDEVAGVLAHEIGHIERRDVMAGLIRDFGLSLLLGGADGGAVAQALVTNRYSRSAERGADRLAIARLARADITPAATAAFFARLTKGEAAFGRAAPMLGYLSSHPLSAARRQAFAGSARPGHAYRSALDGAQWRAVRALCGGQTPPR